MIDIVIPLYNSVQYSQKCVASIRKTLAGIPYQIHLLDNGSTDETAVWLDTLEGADVRKYWIAENIGAPAGRNYLLNSFTPTDFVIFADSDVEFKPDWIGPFLDVFRHYPQAGIVGPDAHNIYVYPDHRETKRVQGRSPKPCDILMGCLFLTTGELVRKVGGYDVEICGLYWHEDDDYCVRAIGAGYQNYWVYSDRYIHHGNKSANTTYPPVRSRSRSKAVQRALAEKWYRMGLIGPDHRPRAMQLFI